MRPSITQRTRFNQRSVKSIGAVFLAGTRTWYILSSSKDLKLFARSLDEDKRGNRREGYSFKVQGPLLPQS
jgi:hypothetical protein